ncbi:hypothetical protein ACOMHN_032397 [Nucella lapillus]
MMLTQICRSCLLAQRQTLYRVTPSLPKLTKQSKTCLQLRRTKTLLPAGERNGSTLRKVTRLVLVSSLVPAGVGMILSATKSGRRSGFCIDWPSWIRVQCEDAVTILPSQQQRIMTGSLVKLIRKLYASILLCVQCVRVCLMFGPLLCLYPITLLSDRLYAAWLKALFHAVQRCGPIYIKLGQWASTRRDLFSAQFCEQFSLLHTAVQSHQWRHTEHALRVAYGKRWHDVIKIDMTQQPLGSGCVAQVYKGYLHVDNVPSDTLEAIEDTDLLDDVYFRDGVEIKSLTESFSPSDSDDLTVSSEPEAGSILPYEDDPSYITVAIKVVHPDVGWQISRDLTLMRAMARVLETLVPSVRWVNLTQCVDQFSLTLTRQMDMVHEARCLKRFHADFADMPCVRIPVPVMSLVRRNILVESFEEGQPISNFIASKEETTPGLKEKMADIGIDALLQMVFVKNFVHGDLHPGNILVQNVEAFTGHTEESLVMVDVGDVIMATVSPKECPLRLVLLDCGITALLGKEDRIKFRQVFTAVVKGEGEVVADLFLEKSLCMECKDPEAFRKDMVRLVNTARETTLQLSKFKVSELLTDVFAVLSRHHIQLESNFATIILAIGIVEGLGRSLDPQLNILSKASTLLLGQTFFG